MATPPTTPPPLPPPTCRSRPPKCQTRGAAPEASATACQIGCYPASAEPKLSPNWCQWLLTCQGSQLLHCSLCLQAHTPLKHWLILFLPSTFARALVTTELPTSAQSFSPLSHAPRLASSLAARVSNVKATFVSVMFPPRRSAQLRSVPGASAAVAYPSLPRRR